MREYCTLFDANYKHQGIALIESLEQWTSQDIKITVLALDVETERVLATLEKRNLEVVSLQRLMYEIPLLDKARKNREWNEFCWTLASVFMWWNLEWRGKNEVTYLDADTFFFDDPEICHHEMGKKKQLGIVPHRFPPKEEWKAENGFFNVSVVIARGATGFKVIREWAHQCLEWCYYKLEDGKFGDQKYLDAWPKEYPEEVYIFENPRIGVAPWNIKMYEVTRGPVIDSHPIVFYHFHELKYEMPQKHFLTYYELTRAVKEFIYTPYLRKLNDIYERIKK